MEISVTRNVVTKSQTILTEVLEESLKVYHNGRF